MNNVFFILFIYILYIFSYVVFHQVEWESPRLSMNFVAGSAQVMLTYSLCSVFRVGSKAKHALIFLVGIFSSIPILWTFDQPPKITREPAPSSMLQSITLQTPDQGIRLLLPLPRDYGNEIIVRTMLTRPYDGPSRIAVWVNGTAIGTMSPAGTIQHKPGSAMSLEEIEVPFKVDTVGVSNPMEIILRQPVPDPALRIAVWSSHLGTAQGANTAWFANGSHWARGIPSSRTGGPSEAVPIVWLLNADP